jgi:hypothetical protein
MMRPSCPAYTHEVRMPVHWKASPTTNATQRREPISRASRYIPHPAIPNWIQKMKGKTMLVGPSRSAIQRTG